MQSQSLTFRILSCHNDAPGEGWEEQLAEFLGGKPRRLSRWCQLGLWGALRCLHKPANKPLSSEVPIRVYSENSTVQATNKALAQLDEHLPMPVTFMQTLPGQLFNAIGAAADWHGDGFTVAGANNRRQTEIGLLKTMQRALLLAWVDEQPEAVSRWIFLERAAEPAMTLDRNLVSSVFATSAEMRWLQLNADGQLFQSV